MNTSFDYQMQIEQPVLNVPYHVIKRAVRNLSYREALILIQGSFMPRNNDVVTLDEAKLIYAGINSKY